MLLLLLFLLFAFHYMLQFYVKMVSLLNDACDICKKKNKIEAMLRNCGIFSIF